MSRRVRRLAVAGALVLAAVGVAACTSNDSGGVITGTTQPTSGSVATTSTTAPVVPTSVTLPGGTLPSS